MNESIMGTQVVTQIAILVNDIETTAKAYAELFGIDVPEIYATPTADIAKTLYMGQPTEGRTKQAFFQVGDNLAIELLEPDHEPSTWRNDLNVNGEGVHHIAFVVNGIRQVVKKFEQKGIKEIQKGEWPGGQYAYLDTKDWLKVTLELLEMD